MGPGSLVGLECHWTALESNGPAIKPLTWPPIRTWSLSFIDIFYAQNGLKYVLYLGPKPVMFVSRVIGKIRPLYSSSAYTVVLFLICFHVGLLQRGLSKTHKIRMQPGLRKIHKIWMQLGVLNWPWVQNAWAAPLCWICYACKETQELYNKILLKIFIIVKM